MGQDKTTKVWKVAKTSNAAFVISDKSAAMVGSPNAAVIVDEKGITLAGPVSIVSDAQSTRRGALFVGLNDFLHMIPSTITTPIPSQQPSMPTIGLMGMSKDVAFFLALLI